MIRRAVVALTENGLEIGVECRSCREFVSVEAHAVLELKVVRPLVRIAQRQSPYELAPAPDSWRERSTEGRRPLCLEIRQRVERERSERVRLLIQRECIP